jgi:hypothetical protein
MVIITFPSVRTLFVRVTTSSYEQMLQQWSDRGHTCRRTLVNYFGTPPQRIPGSRTSETPAVREKQAREGTVTETTPVPGTGSGKPGTARSSTRAPGFPSTERSNRHTCCGLKSKSSG